jgi:hemoglobin
MRAAVLFAALLVLTGCSEGQKANPAKRPSLYDRLGGENALVKVVDDFVANVVADPKIRPVHKEHFLKGDVPSLKKKLVDQIGEAAGGPQKYTGKNMKDAHKGMGITDADFDALVGDLRKALDENKVAPADRDELLDMLGKMRGDVIEKPAPKATSGLPFPTRYLFSHGTPVGMVVIRG